MAEFDEPLLRFDNILLDVNENPPTAENCACSNVDDIHVVPNTEIKPQCDVTVSEILQPSKISNNYIEVPGDKDDTHSNELDILLSNVDEHDSQKSVTLQEISNSSAVSCNFIDMPRTTFEHHTNELDAFQDEIRGSTNNRNSNPGIHNSESNFVGDMNELDFPSCELNLSNNGNAMITEFNSEDTDLQVKDEEFHDAVQFFKDQSSFSCLENAGNVNALAEPLIARSSLYVNFDPLHTKFYSQSEVYNGLQEIVEDEVLPKESVDNAEKDVPDIVNKHLESINSRESLGNILISFDSPVTIKDNSQSLEKNKCIGQSKLYTEEELQQILKTQELCAQETFLKKQQDLEAKIHQRNILSNTFHCLLKEFVEVTIALSEKEKVLNEKLELAEKENDKLKEDLKTSVEDLQSVESTFADFHKRYEQFKSMLKVYTQNEGILKQQLENMKVQLQEKEDMYKVLQTRTQETLDKANAEIASVKKTEDAQVAVLKAQLKKSELKISSLESDLKHVKIENSKLSVICDELMAKVSEG